MVCVTNYIRKSLLPLGITFFLAGCASTDPYQLGNWQQVETVSIALFVTDMDPDRVRVVLHTDEVVEMSEPRVIEDRLEDLERSVLLEEINYLEVWVGLEGHLQERPSWKERVSDDMTYVLVLSLIALAGGLVTGGY